MTTWMVLPAKKLSWAEAGAVVASTRVAATKIRAATFPPPLAGEGQGERLSGLSSCKCIQFSRITCFGIESDEELSGERDAHYHFWFSGFGELLMEFCEASIEAAGDIGDEEQNRAY